jgi:putative radical SAM enzyme (TIGR03279 family)
MPAIVNKVEENSIAQELEIRAGDEILSIDGMQMQDLIDYNFLCKSEFLTIEIRKTLSRREGERALSSHGSLSARGEGAIEIIELEKDYDEDLGIVFESAVFDKVRPCTNKCIFCFVDQQPAGLRDTLYVKDDDYRLSYLQGTYITLTNLRDEDRKRIARMHLGPFYVSVHTSNPDLRAEMLRNPKAARVMEDLQWFAANDIPFHAQIVLCPGYNDGAELERTLKDLDNFGENLLSVAIVPVGLTKYRPHPLTPVRLTSAPKGRGDCSLVDAKSARETLEIASKYPKVCCSDEFFLLADEPIPPAAYYGNFGQLSDGVGAIRLLLDDFAALKLPQKINRPLRAVFATSFAAKAAMEAIAAELNKIENLEISVAPVKSTYWGDDITVAGLITSEDLIATVNSSPSPCGRGLGGGVAHRYYAPYIKDFARELRKNMTSQEKKLWAVIRLEKTGDKFRRQFSINDKYIADFVCLKKRLIIEVDGGQHNGNFNDVARTFYLEKENFKVIRFWNNEIDKNLEGCYEKILQELNTPHPSPQFLTPPLNPLPQGEGKNIKNYTRSQGGMELCDIVVIASVMLRPYSEDFLDGKNLDYVREKTGKDFFLIQNIYSVKEFVDYLKNY